MSAIKKLYGRAPALLTDLYQLTMAYAHWYNGTGHRDSVFHLFYRQAPFDNGFALACGIEVAIDYIHSLRFTESDIAYLATIEDNAGERMFDDGFLAYLRDFRFTGNVDAVPEGTAVFPHQPMIRVTGPIIEAQLLETALLNLTNFPTLLATKAARIAYAAEGDSVHDFGLRKAQGIDGGVTAARAAYIGGCAATSNVLAGRLFGIPVSGTHAHSWVMSFDHEIDAFDYYAQALPNHCVFLVDTYNSLEGIENAIRAGKKLRARGHELHGIRLDSGDLAQLSRRARRRLDSAGFENTMIAASSSLDERTIASLKARGAPIVFWGIGTRMITAQPDAALDGVYKMGAIREDDGRWSYRMKMSDTPGKLTRPGVQQIRRFLDDEDKPRADLLYDEAAWATAWRGGVAEYEHSFDPESSHVELLKPMIQQGERVGDLPDLPAIRDHAMAEFAYFAERPNYPALIDDYLDESTDALRDWLAKRHMKGREGN